MFSKALFKQSCKANGTMWSIITFAVCFMLACVMLISGNGNIGGVKNSIQDTIITQEVDAQMQKRALSYYSNAEDGLIKFDSLFSANAADALSYLQWLASMPNRTDFAGNESAYQAALSTWFQSKPEQTTEAGTAYVAAVTEWQDNVPVEAQFSDHDDYLQALENWNASSPINAQSAATTAYTVSVRQLQTYVIEKAITLGYKQEDSETQEMLGSVMYILNPDGTFDDFWTSNGESAPDDYEINGIITAIQSGSVEEYLSSNPRTVYRQTRAKTLVPCFIAGNMVKPENIQALTQALSAYGVTQEKYQSFGYDYSSIKNLASTAVITYQARREYELEVLQNRFTAGEFASETEYKNAVAEKEQNLAQSISSSFLSTLPEAVSSALEEIGQANLYTLIVGSIFYKLAGLLLPIIYMIMASNNLIAGQVDSGSMAYVLSTSTKRITVVFTQAVYLIGSLFAMFALTTVTGCVCLSLLSADVGLTYGNLLLLNLGAFLVLFALSGLCFFTSCLFDRSKRSMAIGGGLSIFALVAAMLGLFGSPVIPSVVRLDALNYFNYATVISLFDVISIIDGTSAFVWKFIILFSAAIVGYVAGSARFVKKDLPL